MVLARHHRTGVVEQVLDREPRCRRLARRRAHVEIDAAFAQSRLHVREQAFDQLQLHVRVALAKGRQRAGQHAHVRHDRKRSDHLAGAAAVVLREFVARACGLVHDGRGADVELSACIGQHHAGRLAQEQLRAQFLFQRPDAARQRRLRHAQAPRRGTQAAVLHDGREVGQLFQLHAGGCANRITVAILPSFWHALRLLECAPRTPGSEETSTMVTLLRRGLLAAFASVLLAAPLAQAQEWPTKPVRMIVPTGAGSAPDVIARLLADRLGAIWSQPVVVDNKPGAGGIPGMSALANGGGDGHTIGFVPTANAAVTPLVYKNPQFNIDTLQAVATVGISPLMLVAPANAPFNNLAELEKYAKAHPGKVNFGAAQLNSLPHLAGELLSKMGGLGFFTVPYATPPAAITAALSGDVAVTADGIPGVQQHIKAGKLKALAVTTATRVPGYEAIPAVAETYPGYEAIGWFQVLVPAGFPAARLEALSRDVNTVLRQPEVARQLNELGVFPQQSTPASAREFLAGQRQAMKKLVAELGLPQQ